MGILLHRQGIIAASRLIAGGGGGSAYWGQWALDEGTGDPADSSGNGRTLSRGSSVSWQNDGTRDFLRVATSPSDWNGALGLEAGPAPGPNGDLMIEWEFIPTEAASQGFMLLHLDGSNNVKLQFSYNSGTPAESYLSLLVNKVGNFTQAESNFLASGSNVFAPLSARQFYRMTYVASTEATTWQSYDEPGGTLVAQGVSHAMTGLGAMPDMSGGGSIVRIGTGDFNAALGADWYGVAIKNTL